MSFPAYPSYRDSGVEWLGEVPSHWTIRPLKHLVRLRSGGTPSKDNLAHWQGEIPWASAKDLKSDILSGTIDNVSEKAIADGVLQLIPTGSIIVLVRGMMLARAFPVSQTGVPLTINQDLKALLPGPLIDTSFLAWALRGTSAESLNRLDEAGHGTKALRMDAWSSLSLPLPPYAEQKVVASFLDRETTKIDALVAEQHRLIALLKEKRQAVISHAVTKGLNPAVPMKDSGIRWLGQVPSHWEVKPLSSLTRPATSITYGIVQAGPALLCGHLSEP